MCLTAKQLYKFLGHGRQFTEVRPTQTILSPRNKNGTEQKNTSYHFQQEPCLPNSFHYGSETVRTPVNINIAAGCLSSPMLP